MGRTRALLLDYGRQESIGEELKSLLSNNFPDLLLQHEIIAAADSDRVRRLAFHSSVGLCFLLPQAHVAEAGVLLRLFNDGTEAPPTLLVVDSKEQTSELLELASDFLMTPLRTAEVLSRVHRWNRPGAAEDIKLTRIQGKLGLKQLVGTSPVFVAVVNKIPVVARSDATVIILGETGTGKEVFARAIHYLGRSASGPFLPVNCGAIPTELMENELFGHTVGAYTGACSAAVGLIQQSDGGTLFLDEVDALPLAAQVKLLRFLQEKEFRPLGSQKPIKADVRVIAASNADIRERVKARLFRQDLFYRLNVLSLQLPALRHRVEDIPALAWHFLARLRERSGNAPKTISIAALRRLQAYGWPGNVRELENVIEGSAVFCTGNSIEAADVRLPAPINSADDESFQGQKARLIANFEESYLRRMLEVHRHNISRAARAAGKDRRSFWELLRKYQLHRSVAD